MPRTSWTAPPPRLTIRQVPSGNRRLHKTESAPAPPLPRPCISVGQTKSRRPKEQVCATPPFLQRFGVEGRRGKRKRILLPLAFYAKQRPQ